MNIQTTTRPAPASALNNLKSAAATAPEEKPATEVAAAPQESFTPAADNESRGSAALRGAIRKGVAWGDVAEKPLGGMTAIGLAIGGGLALSLGGAMVGGIAGGTLGSAVAALQADGPIGFLGHAFSNWGSAISVGSTIGSVAGIVGGGVLGLKVGSDVARAAAFIPGAVVGGIQGAVNPGSVPPSQKTEPKEPQHQQELRGIFKTGAKVGGGFGLLSGATGGFVTGATLTAAGALITDVAQGDFSMKTFISQLGPAALIGGGIGAVAGGTIGGLGGEAVFGKVPQWAWDKTGGRFIANRPGIHEHIAKREDELTVREEGLRIEADNLARETQSYREQHKATSEALDTRENQTASDEKRVSQELSTVEGRIEANAQSDYDKRSATPDPALDGKGSHGVIGERKSLDSWDSKLQGWEGDLNNFRSELIGWEKKLDNKIDAEAGAIFGEERKPIDGQFAEMHAKLDDYEKRLDKYEIDINNRIQSKYEAGISAEKPGVVSDLNAARSEKQRAESELSDARSQKNQAQSRVDSAESSREAARRRLSNAESEESSLRSRINSLQSRISSLRSQLSSCRSGF